MFAIYNLLFIVCCVLTICGAGNIGYVILMSHKLDFIGSICVFILCAIIYNIIIYFFKTHKLHEEVTNEFLEEGFSLDLKKYLNNTALVNLEKAVYSIAFWLILMILIR